MVHQELNQALKRNVMDNIWLGRYPTVGPFTSEKKMYADTVAIFDDLGIHVNPRTIMSTMPVSQRQMVEIAKAVSYHSEVIVFDEPTSSLTETEVEHLFRIINMLRDRGCGIIYISHKMEEILRISDDVTVMRDGAWVATEPASQLTMEKHHQAHGRPRADQPLPAQDHEIRGEVALEVEGLTAMYSTSATFPSACARARSSALPAWTAPAVPRFWKTSSASPPVNPAPSAWTAERYITAVRPNASKTASRC